MKIQIFQPNLPLDFRKPLKNLQFQCSKGGNAQYSPKRAPGSIKSGLMAQRPPLYATRPSSQAVCCGSWICRTSSPDGQKPKPRDCLHTLDPADGTVCSLFAIDVFMREQHFWGMENRSRTCCALKAYSAGSCGILGTTHGPHHYWWPGIWPTGH